MKIPRSTAIGWWMLPAKALPFDLATGEKSPGILWFSISLGDGLWAFDLTDQIKEAFEPLFVRAGRPMDMAVFTRYESEGRLQCEVMAYFSPAAAIVAQQFKAMPCEKPLPDNLDLLVGNPDCRFLIFPETE